MTVGSWDIGIVERVLSAPQSDALRQIALQWQTDDEHFWSYEEIVASLKRPEVRVYHAVEHGSQAADGLGGQVRWQGFLLAEVGPFTTDLLYIHVERQGRRSGLGRALLTRLIADLSSMSTQEALFLEVRVGNGPAQNLYRSLGMVEVGRRTKYYANGDDALVFKLDLPVRPTSCIP